MTSARRIEIYDTTLRDGTQGEGFNLSLQDKLAIAQKLDELGVDYVEGGFPLSNPKDEAFFRDVRELKLKNAKVAAFGMTRRRGAAAKDDAGLKALLEVWELSDNLDLDYIRGLKARLLSVKNQLKNLCGHDGSERMADW